MSWALAKAQLVSVIEATTPTTQKRGLPAAFAHVPEQPATLEGNGRTFRFSVQNPRGVGPLMPSTQALRSRVEVSVEVDYGVDLEPEELDDAMMQDYLVLRAALLDDSGWDRPSSTIENVFPGTSPDILPATIDRDETGVRLVIVFDLEFRG
jgi:hypothetical protein